ncbi:MAG: DNA gyrase subunit A [Promethearchaeota archaeon]
MATPPPTSTPPPVPATKIIDRDLKTELSKSYIDYAMSVIVGRAIPDVRDGLKPVQRRILYSMDQNNFTYNHPHRKCARIVGDCLGKYHPHGDQSVYNALVRLAQDFSVRFQLIDGQGNFGSVDGDAPAAMRYTEARLARISNEMLQDLDKDTVDFQDNFDGSLQEPKFLPAKLPLLLMNGATGIAVGMSTNMAPHNLQEVADAICAAIDMGPENFTPLDVLKYIKGPDFPTGAFIMGRQGIENAITTGRGSIVIRGKTEIVVEGAGKKKDAIVITELPYMVNKSKLIKNIADLVNRGVIPEISDLRDESDRKGMRVFIELKQNSDANACLNRLFQRTQLQNTFSIINLALINNGLQPKVLNYAEILQEFITHREKVISRRTAYDLKKAKARMHIIEGLLIAISAIDEVVRIIKASSDIKGATTNLITKFSLTSIQAAEILKMPLSRLTSLQTKKLNDEQADMLLKIQDYEEILADRQNRLNIIKKETQDLAAKFSNPRRSIIKEMVSHGQTKIRETIPEEECVIMITKNQTIKRITLENYQAQGRGGKGKRGMKVREEDIVEELFIASSHDTILLFTQHGRVYSIPAFTIPLMSRTARGKALVNYVNLQPGEVFIDITNISSFDKKQFLVFVSARGIAKRVSLDKFSKIRQTGIICMSIREGDQLVRVKRAEIEDDVLIATEKGYAIHFPLKELRSLGRTAQGVKGITLRSTESDEKDGDPVEDRVVDLVVHDPKTQIITITKRGYGKSSPLKLYRLTHRGGKGVINIKLRTKLDEVIAVKPVPSNQNLLLVSDKGIIIRIRTADIRKTGRAAKGVILMRLDEEDSVSSVALCDPEEIDPILEEIPLVPIPEQPDDSENGDEDDDLDNVDDDLDNVDDVDDKVDDVNDVDEGKKQNH